MQSAMLISSRPFLSVWFFEEENQITRGASTHTKRRKKTVERGIDRWLALLLSVKSTSFFILSGERRKLSINKKKGRGVLAPLLSCSRILSCLLSACNCTVYRSYFLIKIIPITTCITKSYLSILNVFFQIFCKIVAILLHYFSLASFCWMLLEAVMLYLKVISVFRGEYVQMKKFCIFGWGMYNQIVRCPKNVDPLISN